MSELHRLEVRFPGEELASYTDNRGVTYRLFFRNAVCRIRHSPGSILLGSQDGSERLW
jgi:hypothetical protein